MSFFFRDNSVCNVLSNFDAPRPLEKQLKRTILYVEMYFGQVLQKSYRKCQDLLRVLETQ